MNPWLQRALLSIAAGATASGVLVGTAKKPRKLKKRKKKKGEKDAPVQLGALALADAKLPAERSLTAAEWRDAVVARTKAVGSVFKRKEKPAAVDDEGARVPDEIEAKDGTKVRSASAAKKKGKKKRNKAKDMPPATLWESARESFKQTVKESVREEVKETPIGGALDALNKVGQKVKEGATAVAENVQKATADVKLDVKVDDELKGKIASKLSDWKTAIEAAVETVRKTPPPSEKPVAIHASEEPKEIAPPAEGPPSSPDELVVQPGAVEEQTAPPIVESELMPPPLNVKPEKPPIDPEKVKAKLKSGFSAVNSWFQAQSATTSKRVRAVANDAMDAVEAKDAEVVEAKDAGDGVEAKTAEIVEGAETKPEEATPPAVEAKAKGEGDEKPEPPKDSDGKAAE